jgi:peptidoglycan/xylan/chitin deacetylase (PgdA/CDA1 family)
MAERWAPSPAIRGSVVLHAAAALGVAAMPAAWPWGIAAVAGNHLLLTAAGLWPRSTLLGSNLRRLPERNARLGQVGLCFDDGPDSAVTPVVLDLLDRYGAKASFFCIGERASRHPGLVRDIVAGGHTVENHTWRHSPAFSTFGVRAIRREVLTAQGLIEELSGRSPRFFKAPAGLRNPLLEPVLCREGLRLTTWTRRGYDTVWRSPAAVAGRLTRGLGAGDLLMLHDGSAARTAEGVPVVLAVLPVLLEALAEHGLTAVSLEAVADD